MEPSSLCVNQSFIQKRPGAFGGLLVLIGDGSSVNYCAVPPPTLL